MNNYKSEEPRKEVIIEETPSGLGSVIGTLLGLAYLLFLPVIFVQVVQLFTGPAYTEFDSLFINALSQIIAGIATIVGMFFCVKKIAKNVLKGFNFNSIIKGFEYAALVFVASFLIGLFEQYVLKSSQTNTNQNTLNLLLINRPVLGLIFTCIMAPIVEELIFRFFIFGTLKKKKVWVAYVVSGISFGLIHFISTLSVFLSTRDSSIIVEDLKTLPGYIVAGLLFCFIYHKTKKISCSIVAHMTYNLIVSLFLLASFKTAPFMIKDVETDNGSITVAYNYNLNTQVEIEQITIYLYDPLSEEKTLYKTLSTELETGKSKGEYTINNLTVDTVYYIQFEYKYEETNLKQEKQLVREVIGTYAIASKK